MPTTAAFAVSVVRPTRHSWIAMTGAPARRVSASRRARNAGRCNGFVRRAATLEARLACAAPTTRQPAPATSHHRSGQMPIAA